MSWNCMLRLNHERSVVAGSPEALADAVRCGSELRVATDFRHNEHLYPGGDDPQIVREVSDFRTTYLLDDRWVAGIMTLRMPVASLDGFGPRASMSFFLYNQNAQQAVAKLYLDGQAPAESSAWPGEDIEIPKFSVQDECDVGTNAPSRNFIYEFEEYRYLVWDSWRQVLAHDDEGRIQSGSFEDLERQFASGCEIKVAIQGLCDDLADGPNVPHELIVHCGSGYLETESRRFAANTQPTVRVKPAVPLWYQSGGWDFGWLLPRTDGVVFRWLCDPYTLKFQKSETRHAIRWFVR